MESKTTRIILIAAISIFIVGGAFSGGVIVGWLIPSQVRPPALFQPAATQQAVNCAYPIRAGGHGHHHFV